MLSSVLSSKVAIQANRRIMRAFVAYRHLAELPIAATYLELRKEIEAVRAEVNVSSTKSTNPGKETTTSGKQTT